MRKIQDTLYIPSLSTVSFVHCSFLVFSFFRVSLRVVLLSLSSEDVVVLVAVVVLLQLAIISEFFKNIFKNMFGLELPWQCVCFS